MTPPTETTLKPPQDVRSCADGRRITIKDVAARAGIGHPSVSAVLNGGKGPHVAEATRLRIIEAASELGYRPNMAARSMKSGKSGQVGVLVRNNSRVDPGEALSHPLAYEFVLGISEGLEEAGYMMSFVRLSDVDPEKHVQSSAFQGHLLDGLIVVSDVPAASRERLESLVPHCVWLDNSTWCETSCVRRDEYHAGFTAVHKLAEADYHEVIFMGLPASNSHYSGRERLRGATDAARQSGIRLCPVEDECRVWERLTEEIQPESALLLSSGYHVSALQRHFCMSTTIPGRHFAVASCDSGFHGNSLEWPELARVEFDRFAMGQAAARMMLDCLSQEKNVVESVLMPGDWIAGATAPHRKMLRHKQASE